VLAFDLCPWAAKAWTEGQVRQHVVLDVDPTAEGLLPVFDAIAAEPEIAIGLVIFPRLAPPLWARAAAFDAFAERVRRADHARRPDAATSPPSPAFLVAAFHPGAPETFATPPQLVSFLRRTPDPTLQLVRTAVLRRATGEGPAVSDDVTLRNFASAGARGGAAVDAVLRDIRRDRDETYARLGERATAPAAANLQGGVP
jgi:hypothetical protein